MSGLPEASSGVKDESWYNGQRTCAVPYCPNLARVYIQCNVKFYWQVFGEKLNQHEDAYLCTEHARDKWKGIIQPVEEALNKYNYNGI